MSIEKTDTPTRDGYSYPRRTFLIQALAYTAISSCARTSSDLRNKLSPEANAAIEQAIKNYEQFYNNRKSLGIKVYSKEEYEKGFRAKSFEDTAAGEDVAGRGSSGRIWLDTDNINARESKSQADYTYDLVLHELTHAARPAIPSFLIRNMSLGPEKGASNTFIGLSFTVGKGDVIDNQSRDPQWFYLFEHGAADAMARAVKNSSTKNSYPDSTESQQRLERLVNIGLEKSSRDVHALFRMLRSNDVRGFVAMMIGKEPQHISGEDLGNTMEVFEGVEQGLDPEIGYDILIRRASSR